MITMVNHQVGHGQALILVDIDLDDADIVTEFIFQLHQHRVRHLAGTTLGGKKSTNVSCSLLIISL